MNALSLVLWCLLYVQGKHAEPVRDFHHEGLKLNLKNLTSPYDIKLDSINISSTKIINGVAASGYDFPYQAALYVFGESGATVTCGGSLIKKRYILTAAHCIFERPIRIMAVLGNSDLNTYSSNEIRVDVHKYIVHPRFNSETLNNDICLLELASPVQYNTAIQPIALPSSADIYTNYLNQMGKVSGFGKTSDWGTVTTQLMYSTVRVIDRETCNRYFTDRDAPVTTICTSGVDRTGACQGDSGGPLVVNGKLIGVVSFGTQICSMGYPTVYTRVPNYMDWISYHTNMRGEK